MLNRSQRLDKLRPRLGLITSLRMLRHLRQERSPLLVLEGTAEVQEAKRRAILALLQLRRGSKKLMKRLLLLPRLMGVSEGATVATGARATGHPRKKSGLLSVTEATDRRVARIAPLEMIPALLRLSRESRSVDQRSRRTSTTLAEKCLAATIPVPLEEASTEGEGEAELTSRRELHTTEAMLPLTKSVTATGTCLTTEETRISTSRSSIGSRTVGILAREISMTNSPDQATIPLLEDQSDLPWVLP